MKTIAVKKIVMGESKFNYDLDQVLIEVIILSLTENREVEFTFNGHVFNVVPEEILKPYINEYRR